MKSEKVKKKNNRFFTVSGTLPKDLDKEFFFAYLNFLRAELLLEQHYCSISLSFVGEDEISCLNRQYRQKNEPTDILTFPLPGRVPGSSLGDIYLCESGFVDDFSLGSDLQLCFFLVAHGVLHLLGWTHETQESFDFMVARQKDLLQTFMRLHT